MKILIFCTETVGHYLEYIHHMYMYAFHKMLKDEIKFILPITFSEKMNYMNFPTRNNINLLFITSEEVESYSNENKIWRKNLKKTALLRKYIKKNSPDSIFLPDIINYLPWILFMFNGNRVSGIEYRIPGRRADKIRFKERISDNIKLLIYAYAPCINRIFLLNDRKFPLLYNKHFRTSHFLFLPDPVVPIISHKSSTDYLTNIKRDDKKVFLHCGGMGERKGTYTIIDTIKLLTREELRKCIFIFAGRIDAKRTFEFKSQIEELSINTSVYFIEGFLEFDMLAELFKCSDYILVPYKNVSQSSGVIGHAAQYGKAVIGPHEGLLGALIEEYKLGFTIPELNAQKLKDLISKLIQKNTQTINGKRYLEINSPYNFANVIYNSIKTNILKQNV